MNLLKSILLILIFSIITSCSLNKIDEIHGVNNLIEKSKLININFSNKKDVIELLGPSILIDDKNNNFSYFEVRKTKNKFGKNIIYLNNYIVVKFNKNNIVTAIEIFDTVKNSELEFSKDITNTYALKETLSRNIFSSMRKRMENAKKQYQK